MSNFRNSAKEFARIAFPYFKGEDRVAGWLLLGSVVGLQLFQVWLEVQFNEWNRLFYDAIQSKDWDTFISQLLLGGLPQGDFHCLGFTALATLFILSAVYQIYLQQWLQIRWRALADRPLYRALARLGHALPHAAQGRSGRQPRPAHLRRHPHVHQLDAGHRHLATRLDRHARVLRRDPVEPVGVQPADDRLSDSYNIPGYLVWAALIYAILGTWVTHLVGRPLIKLNFDQQRYEADFRFSLVRLRENAEEVTLLSGEAAEEDAAAGSLLARGRQLVRHHAAY